MKAHQFLQAGLDAMQQRAATYDKPEGERSMGATVGAFRAITGHSITEEQGWLFMAILKAVRSQQGNYSADSYVDGAAYFGLAGEAACAARADKTAPAPDNAPPGQMTLSGSGWLRIRMGDGGRTSASRKS